MAVNPEYANQLLADFQEKVEGIVRTSGLEHHMNTSHLSDINAVKDNYVNTVMSTFTLPTVSEGELQAEMNVALVEITRMARQKGKREASQIAGIGAAVNSSSPADSASWNNVIGDAGHRIDKIVTMYADQINNMPKPLRARIDNDLSKILDSINDAYNANPSGSNAEMVSRKSKTPSTRSKKIFLRLPSTSPSKCGVNRPQENDSAPRKDVRATIGRAGNDQGTNRLLQKAHQRNRRTHQRTRHVQLPHLR